jgi:hypothetical protein
VTEGGAHPGGRSPVRQFGGGGATAPGDRRWSARAHTTSGKKGEGEAHGIEGGGGVAVEEAHREGRLRWWLLRLWCCRL